MRTAAIVVRGLAFGFALMALFHAIGNETRAAAIDLALAVLMLGLPIRD